MNVDEASEMSPPHPGGDDVITYHADLGKIKQEHNGGIPVGVPKESAETRWKGNCCMLNIAACAKATSSNDNKPFLVKQAFPKGQLTFPVKEEPVKVLFFETLEEMRKQNDHTRSSENTLTQTPHDIVPREPAHNAGGASNSEQVHESQIHAPEGNAQGVR